jgi:hypothetical protein
MGPTAYDANAKQAVLAIAATISLGSNPFTDLHRAEGMKSFFAVLLALPLLSACALFTHQSSDDLRSKPHEKGTIVVSRPYGEVFALVSAVADHCFPTHSLNAGGGYLQQAAAGSILTRSFEIKEGKLGKVEVLTTHLGGEEDVLVSLDIRAVPTGTELDYFVSWRFFGTDDSNSSFKPGVGGRRQEM